MKYPCLSLQGQTDASISAELRQVANGCAYRVKSFAAYDVMDIAFTQQDTSRVGPIEGPQIPQFSRSAVMGSSIMEELKKYMNLSFRAANLLILSYSNAIGSILQ
jgi:hypothetical protein